MGLHIYLLPNDSGEFLLVLQDGPDEERLQGVPSDRRHVLGGSEHAVSKGKGGITLAAILSEWKRGGQDALAESPVFGGSVLGGQIHPNSTVM